MEKKMIKVVRLDKILKEADRRWKMGEEMGKSLSALTYRGDSYLLRSFEKLAEEVPEEAFGEKNE